MEVRDTELLVVGSGIAGCAAALAAAREGASVTLATKASRPEEATTYWAQGGVAVAREDPESFAADVREAGAGECDPAAVERLVAESNAAVEDVLVETLGVPFDTEGGSDERDYTREAAHSTERILHVDASTGREILPRFLDHLAGLDSVEMLEDTAALELLTHEGRVHGAVLERDGEWAPCYAGATVLATGGIGACYTDSTNPAGATGDGIGMAALAGADVADLEYVQFHPTAFDAETAGAADAEDGPGGTFLLSEALRGEGATLLNGQDERFMPARHADAELAPRDVVARAVAHEREATGEVRLDVSPLDPDFQTAFPDLAARCAEYGVDPSAGVPVKPAEHFLCGGIAVDHHGRASLDRLYAVGECARTGVHGANRLASTSLLEGLVWGLSAGEAASGHDPERIEAPELRNSDPALPDGFAAEKFHRLRRTMDEYVGIERDPADLGRAQAVLRRLKGEVDAYARTRTARDLYELRHTTVTALLVARAASENPASTGCHHLVTEPAAPADD
jgi:L-aspartate oxidase